jgi:hypothetical protein
MYRLPRTCLQKEVHRKKTGGETPMLLFVIIIAGKTLVHV